MPRNSRWHRAIATVALILSAASALFVPIADARAQLESATAEVHVEDPGFGGCPQIHDDSCQLCRVVRLTSYASHGDLEIVAFEVDAAVTLSQAVRPACSSPHWPSASPRAPPAA